MTEEQNEMFEGTVKRTSRANQTREKTAQRKPWAPPSMLDAPPAPDGFKHRWIRAETRGFDDTKNISAKMRACKFARTIKGINLAKHVAVTLAKCLSHF